MVSNTVTLNPFIPSAARDDCVNFQARSVRFCAIFTKIGKMSELLMVLCLKAMYKALHVLIDEYSLENMCRRAFKMKLKTSAQN